MKQSIQIAVAFAMILWMSLHEASEGALTSSRQKIDSNNIIECLLVQLEDLCLDGTTDRERGSENQDEDTSTWRCIDHDDETTYKLDGLPPGFLHGIHSAKTILTVRISDETKESNSTRGAAPQQTSKMNTQSTRASNNYLGQGFSKSKRLHLESSSTTFHTRPLPDNSVWHGSMRRRRLDNGSHPRSHGRSLVPKEGVSTLLVIRVTDQTGDAPPDSSEQLSDDIFGTWGDPVNLKSQFAACSGGRLQYEPASGDNIVDGVAELTIPYTVAGVIRFDVEDWVNEELPKYFPNYEDYTQIMYVFPKSIDFQGAAAYAYKNFYRSIFKGGYATKMPVQLHELGHNLGMAHSGYNGKPYADKSGMMGAPSYKDDQHLMCYNPAKSWWLGWYTEYGGNTTLTPTDIHSGWGGFLVGVDDYLYSPLFEKDTYRVLVKIEKASKDSPYDDFYMMYNRKKGVNAEVRLFDDKVTVVSTETMDGISWNQASINDTGGVQKFANWTGDGETELVIQVCEKISMNEGGSSLEYAVVLVYTDDGFGSNQFDCNSVTPSPSAVSTTWPSSDPTAWPTTMKSEFPSISHTTSNPSLSPTSVPTTDSTPEPSSSPSNSWTAMPTTSPTNLSDSTQSPTLTLTRSPSVIPSITPTNTPTFLPTGNPTGNPTLGPTPAPTSHTSPNPTVGSTNSPTAAQTEESSSCTKASIGEQCQTWKDCCSGSCRRPTNRKGRRPKVCVEQSFKKIIWSE